MRADLRLSRSGLLVLGLCVGGLAWAAQSGAPARAQFFFPFFDNRPTTRPDMGYRRHRDGGVIELRPKSHRKRPRAADKKPKAPKLAPAAPENAKAVPTPAPAVEGPPPPYEPQLLRLSEIMGALSYLQTLCGASDGNAALWRDQMENLMSAENAGPSQREKLAGAYNRGLRGYEYSYHVCTPNARLVSERFLDEGARIAHDISSKYRAN
ncbi:TIGR02301 family protein [Rhodoblastus acidophilus]|uniref:TIGR02301 family protein n=1 Tax=Candidatus Rhodoblastus alkanivorans TaxID=2954117 RepID=A0ABS9ZAM7_9HYPH|nr:TIGR02301 family protein [Candidatus Rhodoblastus alkanivorans]MCI4680149.1 TIGR02301 family protein [Candidatus Rhodoblastus alkanivorans]MCI4684106.1 TIGR02301 family protein [Candidatus Rhodoblastus alkanivorans]MDI4641426.1 TIGR02301 family protein [Rhodoblastus acidophilus]